jgi:hypothetical protein
MEWEFEGLTPDDGIKNIILPGVLDGYGTWSLTSREEIRLTMCENRMFGRMFGPKNTRYGVEKTTE